MQSIAETVVNQEGGRQASSRPSGAWASYCVASLIRSSFLLQRSGLYRALLHQQQFTLQLAGRACSCDRLHDDAVTVCVVKSCRRRCLVSAFCTGKGRVASFPLQFGAKLYSEEFQLQSSFSEKKEWIINQSCVTFSDSENGLGERE
jgi:hypothetical protein